MRYANPPYTRIYFITRRCQEILFDLRRRQNSQTDGKTVIVIYYCIRFKICVWCHIAVVLRRTYSRNMSFDDCWNEFTNLGLVAAINGWRSVLCFSSSERRSRKKIILKWIRRPYGEHTHTLARVLVKPSITSTDDDDPNEFAEYSHARLRK